MSVIRISDITVTPVAFADPPLLTAVGVHEPYALRAIIEIATDAGLTGLGETYGDDFTPELADAWRRAYSLVSDSMQRWTCGDWSSSCAAKG